MEQRLSSLWVDLLFAPSNFDSLLYLVRLVFVSPELFLLFLARSCKLGNKVERSGKSLSKRLINFFLRIEFNLCSYDFDTCSYPCKNWISDLDKSDIKCNTLGYWKAIYFIIDNYLNLIIIQVKDGSKDKFIIDFF